MKELLKKYFGYDEFRPMQEDIINNVLAKKDTFVLMPTGGGKSICYQLPALKLNGLTIVISPLISLMKDQVDNLKANGVSAEYINSTLSNEEIEDIQKRCQNKEIRLLYVAPERFALGDFKKFLRTVEISLIAIDEAHCISEWGHDFRPDYRNLKFLKTTFPNVPIIALTATATPKVRDDIIQQLSLFGARVFFSSFNRENLNLQVRNKKNSLNQIVKLLKEYKNESVIIYCFSRKDCDNIAVYLKKAGFNARPYHAGLKPEVRKHNQELFIKDEVNIIVATIAFGMGIDKPDVRLVIHHTFPKNLEGYYQEIGRAGRDGLASDCIMFYSYGDKRKHEFFIDQISDSTVKVGTRNKLIKVVDYCESKTCRRKSLLEYFNEIFPLENCKACDICLDLPGVKEVSGEPEEINEDEIEEIKYKKPKWHDPQEKTSPNKDLFEKLRELRKRIASEKQVPPFIIFGDVSLREMASKLPSNKKEFLGVKGVGLQKLKDYGDAFLEEIRSHVDAHLSNEIVTNSSSNSKMAPITDYNKRVEKIKESFTSAYESWTPGEEEKLKSLYSQKKSIDDIASALSRQPGAIRSRLKKLGLIIG